MSNCVWWLLATLVALMLVGAAAFCIVIWLIVLFIEDVVGVPPRQKTNAATDFPAAGSERGD